MAESDRSNGGSAKEKPQVRVELDVADLINLVSEYIPALKKQPTFTKRVNWVLEHAARDLVQMAANIQSLSDGEAKEADVRELARALGLRK